MKKMTLLTIGLFLVFGNAVAEMATATFKTKDGQKLQVIINKKVVNSTPKTIVRIKGSGGIHQVKIKVFNGPELYVTQEQLKITSGYNNNYIISIDDKNRLEIKKTGSKMIYNYRHRRPDRFYNKRFFALHKRKQPHYFPTNDFFHKINGKQVA